MQGGPQRGNEDEKDAATLEREEFIRKQVLGKHLGLTGEFVSKIGMMPIGYDKECPFEYNNVVFRIDLPSTLSLSRTITNLTS